MDVVTEEHPVHRHLPGIHAVVDINVKLLPIQAPGEAQLPITGLKEGDVTQPEGFLPFSQQELASAIGASRVQVARVCEKLKAQGIVDIKKRRLYVLDRAALAEMASLEVSS